MYVWMDGCMDKWMDGWVGGWLDVRMVCVCVWVGAYDRKESVITVSLRRGLNLVFMPRFARLTMLLIVKCISQ